ncbi:hypothetical protein [Desulfonatronovibrio hydrogenovorans]|uniref:hypothetical protein n=1 Tax=Desulfonatronovibrio hydrogenovorans TaxID=53245 RepID=UPI00048BDA44|nr:hypothetical protein [Desulfonatronovibrio hydrogenovorans]
MYLTVMAHRQELFDLTLSWMNDDFHPRDGERITKIFVYESAISTLAAEHIFSFLGRVFSGPFSTMQVQQKSALREQIISHLPVRTPRTDELAKNFQENPKYYFPYLPVNARIILDRDSRLVAIARIKRLSRVAEKVSFRLVDALFKEIQAEATRLAGQRAMDAGVPLSGLISSPEAMQEDFVAAEENIARRFRDKMVRIDPQAMIVNDIVGFKMVAGQETIERIPELLDSEQGIQVVEIERHEGEYNAVNLLMNIDLPEPKDLKARLEAADWNFTRMRGLDPDKVRRQALEYIDQGESTVQVELILTTPEELMEAEFGRSIHELRILRMRHRQAYSGPLGQNAGYLIEYLLTLASSPTVFIPELPIKMYGRYLPEEISALKHTLFNSTVDNGPLGTFSFR